MNASDEVRRGKSVDATTAGNSAVFNLKDFGGVGDGVTLNTKAIKKALEVAAQAGGGTVYVPPGDYLSGTIRLADNVTLYLPAGTTIWGSKSREDYEEDSSLVYAEDAVNIAIRGQGTIDGNGPSFWKWRYGHWVAGDWRPQRVMRFVRCENLLLEDFTIRNSPAWTIHPIDCDRVVMRGISIINGIYEEDGPNTDGINPDGCTRVRISDCYVQAGDDSIVLKCTKRSARRECRDITVTNCVLITSETALKIGSETYGEFRNITFSNCVVRDAGCGIGLWMRDGGLIDGWVVSNISMTLPDSGVPIYMWCYPRVEGTKAGTVKNVSIRDVTAVGDGGVFMSGRKEEPLQGITLDNIRIFMRGEGKEKFHENPPYPFQLWGHKRAPYDIFCRYVDDLKLRNIQLTWNSPEKAEWGSAIRCWHIKDLEIAGFVGRQSLGSDAPSIWLKDVQGAFIHACRAPEGTETFLKLDERSTGVTLMNNDLSRIRKTVELAPGVDAKEVFESGNRPPRQ